MHFIAMLADLPGGRQAFSHPHPVRGPHLHRHDSKAGAEDAGVGGLVLLPRSMIQADIDGPAQEAGRDMSISQRRGS